jgi:hypothetical protein
MSQVSGKRVVLFFYGGIGLMALIGMGLVIWLLSQPVTERDQRNLSVVLANAYQKHRFDTMTWPERPLDAATNFKSENPELVGRVEKAEKEWGMKIEVVDPEGSPSMTVTYEKPAHLEMKYMLKKSKR